MKLALIVLGIVAVIGWLALGFLFASGPQPEIVVPAEVITKAGPLNISNTLITAWMVMAFLILLSLLATRAMKLVPSGVQNFVEAGVDFLVAQIEEIAGRENGRRFFSLVATIFLFVLVSNWFGLLPFFNAVGKTEDVGHEIFHEIEQHEEEGKPFKDEEKFAAWRVDDAGGVGLVKPRAGDFEFEVEAGASAGDALDEYTIALAEEFTDFEAGEVDHKAAVAAAQEALEQDPDAPKLVLAKAGDGEHHGVMSPALGVAVQGVEFPGQKLALVIPYFRGVYSDVNNTLALALISFVMVEFWGLQSLGLGYLKKFFNFSSPINAFVGVLELISELIRIISFAFRLFGNIFAGEVLILMLTFLVPFLFVDIIYGLELFIGFIQAAVFALLTLVFATMAVEHHGDDAHHQGHKGEDPSADAHHSAAARAS